MHPFFFGRCKHRVYCVFSPFFPSRVGCFWLWEDRAKHIAGLEQQIKKQSSEEEALKKQNKINRSTTKNRTPFWLGSTGMNCHNVLFMAYQLHSLGFV